MTNTMARYFEHDCPSLARKQVSPSKPYSSLYAPSVFVGGYVCMFCYDGTGIDALCDGCVFVLTCKQWMQHDICVCVCLSVLARKALALRHIYGPQLKHVNASRQHGLCQFVMCECLIPSQRRRPSVGERQRVVGCWCHRTHIVTLPVPTRLCVCSTDHIS